MTGIFEQRAHEQDAHTEEDEAAEALWRLRLADQPPGAQTTVESATARYPELVHYADQPAKAITLADALDGYGEQEREVRRDALAKRIAAERSGRLSASASRSPYPGNPAAAARLRAERAAEPAVGPALLGDVQRFLSRFVAYPSEHCLVAAVLWAAHAHLLDSFESTPRLAHLSPEPGSGKTRALEVLELLVPRPLHAVNATPAALFRKVSDEAGPPTILFDEIDTLFGPKAKDNEDVRGMLNAGHRRGATALRCVVRGKEVSVEEFPAYCAVALAGLGDLPDTLMTRSVVIRMRRRAPGEKVDPFRHRQHAEQGHGLRDRLGHWADTVREDVQGAWPEMPDGIEDRNADVWEPLLAVADAAGGQWPDRARVAAVSLVTQAAERPASLGVRLLEDVRTCFDTPISPLNYEVVDVLPTATLVERLLVLDESPWADMRNKPLDARTFARMLGKYDIKPKVLRVGDGTIRGYERAALADAWSRYLPPSRQDAVTSETAKQTEPTCAVCHEPMVAVEDGQRTHPGCDWSAA